MGVDAAEDEADVELSQAPAAEVVEGRGRSRIKWSCLTDTKCDQSCFKNQLLYSCSLDFLLRFSSAFLFVKILRGVVSGMEEKVSTMILCLRRGKGPS